MLLAFVPAIAQAADPPPTLDVSPLHLTVAIVHDPDFPPIERDLAKHALTLAAEEFSKRF